jgi:FAD synthase
MPGCNVYDKEHQQLLVKFFDQVTVKDLEEQAALLASDSKLGSARRTCISFIAATGFDQDITLESVRTITETIKDSLKAREEFKTAFVAPGQDALAVALMFQECLKTEEGLGRIKIFTTKDEAFDWLGGNRQQWNLIRERIAQMCSL